MTNQPEIGSLADVATPGPWHALHGKAVVFYTDPSLIDVAGNICLAPDGPQAQVRRNLEFIAAARTAVPALLADLDRARQDHEQMRRKADDLDANVKVLLDFIRKLGMQPPELLDV